MALDHLRHIRPEDRRVLLLLGIVATLILVGLTVTGIWQFFLHEPDRGWAGYLGRSRNLQIGANPAEGVEAVHGLLADAGAILTLFAGAWLSVVVFHRMSWTSAVALVVFIFAILTGESIRFNASIRDGVVDVETTGHVQFFVGDAQHAVTDRFEVGAAWIIFWTVLHAITIPVLVASSWYAITSERRKRNERADRGPSWLDGLDRSDAPT